jgi:hypothetical protein
MDVRDIDLDITAGTDGADGRSLGRWVSRSNGQGAQMRERYRVAIRRLNRHALATGGNGPRE